MTWRAAVATATLLLAVGTLLAGCTPGVTPGCDVVDVTIGPDDARPGTTLAVTSALECRGRDAPDELSASLMSPDGVELATFVLVPVDGSLRGSVEVPANADAGSHLIEFHVDRPCSSDPASGACAPNDAEVEIAP